MPNAITLAKTFIPVLDKVYKQASLTAKLDGAADLARQGANANELIIPKLDMQGLGDYSRNDGYVKGDVTLTNETVKCNFDRGRMFNVDTMDNLETAGIAFGQLAGEFIRTKVVPELDAFRLATYAGIEGISKIDAGADPVTGEEVIAALRAASNKMDEDEVPYEAIVNGIDVTLSDGTTGHFSLEETDQINLTTAYNAVQQGAVGYPYHADGLLCKIYPAEDIINISNVATSHKLYHLTYCNHMMAWTRRAETVEELERIVYGAELPEDLAENMQEVLINAAVV